jgi:hypothetical protein
LLATPKLDCGSSDRDLALGHLDQALEDRAAIPVRARQLAPPPEPAPPLFPPIDVPPEHAARPTIAARPAAPNT